MSLRETMFKAAEYADRMIIELEKDQRSIDSIGIASALGPIAEDFHKALKRSREANAAVIDAYRDMANQIRLGLTVEKE